MSEIKDIVAENVRIVKELETQIKEGIVASISIKDNALEVVSLVISDMVSPQVMGYEIYGEFKLNGTKYRIYDTISMSEWERYCSNNVSCDFLSERIGRALGKEILKEHPFQILKQHPLQIHAR